MKLLTFSACLALIVSAAAAQNAPAPQTQAQKDYAEAETRAKLKAEAMYPDAVVEGSKLNTAMQATAKGKQLSNSTFFNNPNWPILLATEVAGSMGIPPRDVAPQNPQPPAPAESQPSRVQLPPLDVWRYTHRAPLGHAQENFALKQARDAADQEAAFNQIESFGIYASANTTLSNPFTLADQSSDWTVERGEAYPFLGYLNNMAIVRLGSSRLAVPRNALLLYIGRDHPELAQKYQQEMAQLRAALATQAQQDALDKMNDKLNRILENQKRMSQQQWLHWWLNR